MKKSFFAVIPALLFASCSFWNEPVEEFFSYWTSEAYVTDSSVKVPNQSDSEGIISVASDKNAEVILNIANPKNFNLVMPSVDNTEMIHFNAFDPQPVFGADYMIEKLSSKALKLTYTAQFLKKHEWGQKDLGASITMFADDGREFKKNYTFKIKSNTKPPQPSVILAQTTESTPHYVLCLTVPDMDAQVNGKKLHKDIAQIVINESSYELKINDSGLDFVKPTDESFITRTEVTQLTTHGAEAVPTGNWTLFYKTDRQVGSAYKEYTVTLKDQRGLSSEKLETGTTTNKPAEETVTLNAGTQESGSGTNALPFIIQAAGTKPEAQLIISCTSSGTTVHCTVTDVSTGISTEYNGNPVSVPLGLNGENEKLYEVKYNTKGDGYNPTTLKTKYYKILKLHTVTFNANGGKFADDSTAKTATVLHGRTITAPSTSPTQDGLAFLGWYKEKAGTTAWDFTNDAITKDTTLYAKWSSAALFIKSTDADAWKKLKEEAAKTSGVSVIVIEGEIKATTDSGNSGEITIGRNLTIQGKTGATTDKLDANGDVLGHSNSHRIFKVTGGKTLTLKNLTLKGGRAEKSDSSSPLNASGGGILLESGTVSLSHVTVSDCKAITTAGNSGQGGGIYVKSGTLTINNSMLSANEASKSGGAIYADAGTTVELDICTIQNCKASDGGAIYNDKGSLTIKGASKIKVNEATNNGGAFLIKGGSPNGSLHMENNCIVEQNKAKKGGGIYITDSGTAKILFCRVSQNEAQDGGGSVYIANGTFTIGGSTVITPSTAGETNQKGKNDVYLANGQKITIDDTLTGTHPVARITPATYNKTTQVLGGTPALLGSEHTKFTVTQKDSEKWGVSEQGKLALMEAAIDADASPADAWKKFKEAVKAAGDGAVITVKGEIKATNATDNSGEIVIDNNLTVKKADGATSAVLNANKDGANAPATTHRIFKVTGGKTLTLKNLTLTKGKPDISDEGGNGGAIFAKGGTLNMTNCEVKGNKAANGGGGGIYATDDGSTVSSVTISDSTIGGTGADKNESGSNDSGGGICIGYGCSLTMKNTKVIGNKSDLSGGGIFADTKSTLSMEHCTVSGNSAYSSGGGIHAIGKLTMTGCTVSDNETTGDSGGGVYVSGTAEIKGGSTIYHNKAYVSGGGIYMASSGSGSVTLINATIGGEQYYDDTDLAKTKGNKAKDGGGIYVASGTLSIKDSTLSFNKSTGGGGGTSGGGGISASNGTLNIKGCTFTHNDSGNGTGGGINADNSTLTMTGCTLTDNNAGGGGGGILTSGTSSLTMETCTLSNNVANLNGGGGVYASGNAFTMTDCTLTGNVANNNGSGAVYVADGTFTMKGSSRIIPSSGADENAIGKNEVFLKNGKMITVPAELTGTLPVARITPATYASTTQVLTGGAVGSEHAKFTVTTESGTPPQEWIIKNDGYLQKAPITVSSADTLAWKKLKDAVAAANDGDVFIIDGEIKATNDTDNSGEIEVKKNITIQGKKTDRTDTLNANKDAFGTVPFRIFKVEPGKKLTLENLTLKNGKNNETASGGSSTPKGKGGAIYSKGELEIRNVLITDCEAKYSGGGIYCSMSGSNADDERKLVIKDTEVTSCKAPEPTYGTGGGVYIVGENCRMNVKLSDVKIKNNEASSSAAGLCLYGSHGATTTADSVVLTRVTLHENKLTDTGARGGAGMVFATYDRDSAITLKNCTVTKNESKTFGGGISLHSSSSGLVCGKLILEVSTVSENKAQNGGGIYVNLSNLVMKNTVLTSNTATMEGGGVYVADGTFTMKDSSRITPSSGADENAIGKNEVFLKNGKMITVDGALTGTAPVARITPDTYNTTTQVLTGSAVSSEHGKFTVTPKDLGSGNTQQWEINSTGFLQKTPVVIGGSGDAWKKLKDAVAAANDGDVIIIDGAIKATNVSGGKIEIKKNLTIRGKNGADSDILNANRGNLGINAHSIFVMDSGKTLKLENLTLKGGKGIAGGTLGGGAILIPSGGTTAELSDCVIEDCQAEKGGAIGCGKGGTVKLTNTTIKKCKASGSGSDSGGGAIFASGATVEMTDCTLTGNEAKSGGAIYAVKKDSTASTVTISGGTIGGTGEGEANKATGNGTGSDGGGGIYVGETCTLTMQNSAQVIGNTALFNGAGIYTKGTLIMESCTITDNKTTGANNNTGGGGVYVESGSVEIKDATKIYHNYTDASGGGIYVNDGTVTLKDATIGGEQLYDGTDSGKTKGNKAQGCGGIYVNAGTITMENCTLSSNTALYAGGIQADNGNLTVKGCTLTNNKAGYGGGIYVKGGTFTMENCTLTGNQGDGGVYVEGGTFKMKGSSRITPSTGGDANVAGKNDVYLKDGAKITVDSVLTGTAPVARITVPDDKYLTSTQVLLAGTGVTLENETYKFAVTPQTSTAQPWTVGGNGFLKQGRYTEVPHDKLGTYLANASSTEVNYIEVTGISAADLTGSYGSPPDPGALGQKIKAADPKKVALKLPSGLSVNDMSACFSQCENLVSLENFPSGVTDMRACFYGCENLTTVPAIPATVTSMMECFRYCRSLTTALNIPAGVYDMTRCFQYCGKLQSIKMNCSYGVNFNGAFSGCDALPNGGIQVPSTQLGTYKANAGTMGTTPDKFVGF